jgi:3-mercaptopyruvate sulfurtransferase SseA
VEEVLGLPVSMDLPKEEPTQFISTPRPAPRIDAENIIKRNDDSSFVVVDARTAQEHMYVRIRDSISHN